MNDSLHTSANDETSESSSELLSTVSIPDNTSSYTDSDYLQSIYEINLCNAAFTCIIMLLLVIISLSALMNKFFE